MNRIAILALSTSLIASINATALPLRNTVDEGQLMAARRALDAEEQKKLQKENKHVRDTEKYCTTMVKFRLGQNYHISVTDRRVPTPAEEDQTKYSVAGNADGPDNLSFLCIVSVKSGIISLEHLNLYRVVRDTPETSKNADPAAKDQKTAPKTPPAGKEPPKPDIPKKPGAEKKPPVNAVTPPPGKNGISQKKPAASSSKKDSGISRK
ncbi:hypothetical protein [Succinimonas amylolytica]|uniref:hypothetical protein n=1 Tax=Succinimonas amylolytica TaxID=83769 RepID=UPI00038170B1|nr:hypothetical protein [Succinimonas amylolytica]